MSRERKKRKLKPRIFFFVEGKTEKVFFDALSQEYRLLAARTIKIMDNSGKDWVDKAANMMRNNPSLQPDRNTKIFIIFDKDDLTEAAIAKMKKKSEKLGKQCLDCKLGISNLSFEVWLLAHFQSITNRIENQMHLNAQLSGYLNADYVKGNSRQMETIVKDDKVYVAIENASNVSMFSVNRQSTNIGDIVAEVIN